MGLYGINRSYLIDECSFSTSNVSAYSYLITEHFDNSTISNTLVLKGDYSIFSIEDSESDKRKKAYYHLQKIFLCEETQGIPEADTDFFFPKIYNLCKEQIKTKHFHDIDYTMELNQALYPKRYFVRGELQKVEWFSDIALTDMILRVDIVYQRDLFGFATSRVTTRTWMNVDETENEEKKITSKSYSINMLDQIDEGVTRRGNIIKGLQIPILGMMVATKAQAPSLQNLTDSEIILVGRDFLKLYKSSFQSFIDESHKQIWADIEDATDDWLNNIIDGNGTTIKDYVLEEINI